VPFFEGAQKEAVVDHYLHYFRSRRRIHVPILLLGRPLRKEASRHRRQAALDNEPGTGGENQTAGPATWHWLKGCFHHTEIIVVDSASTECCGD
jgi:hypothetical protein